MIQGGDPTGTGRGGASIYGKEFDDEISNELKHTGAGSYRWQTVVLTLTGVSSSSPWPPPSGWTENTQSSAGSVAG